jgi:hypothetical protein
VNVAAMRPARDMLAEIVEAGDAMPLAVRTADRLARDGDRGALDALDRLAERAEGLRRHALLAREALVREREAHQ